MAQRRYRGKHGRWHVVERLGLAGGRFAGAALVVLACLVAGVGMVMRGASQGFEIARESSLTAQPSEAAANGSLGATEDGDGTVAQPDEEVSHCVVHVDGAVTTPGVVELSGRDLRVADAVEACGGLAAEADTTGVNLAEPLVDGTKIHIPTVDEQVALPAGQPSSSQSATSSAQVTGAAGGLVNINTATAAELQQLRGIGEVTAQAIVDDRTRNGPFATPEDLMRVSGIGEKKFENLSGSICV